MSTVIHYRSNIEEINTTSLSILNLTSSYDFSSDSYISSVIQQLADNTMRMTDALKEEIIKSTLAPLDAQRDKAARVIFLEIKAKLIWPEEEIAQAAQVVMDVLDNYGMEVLNLSYSSESANIHALLQDFKKPDVAAAIQILPNFDTLITHLKADQAAFEEAYQQYISKKAEQENLLPAGKVGEIIKNQINKDLISYLDVMRKVRSETFEECAQKIDMIIKENNSKVKARLTKLREKELYE